MPDARRRLLQALAATPALAAWPARYPQAFARHGRIEPAEPVPELTVLRDDAVRLPLERQLRGRITALHFMFTGCTSTCPIQGATFARVQALLGPQRAERLQLLSMSVDALGDAPASLARWRVALSAGPSWRAAVPIAAHGARLLEWAAAGQGTGADVHATQVLLIDERARLVFRSVDLPDARQVADLLVSLDASSRS
jgi:protein SCO1/2